MTTLEHIIRMNLEFKEIPGTNILDLKWGNTIRNFIWNFWWGKLGIKSDKESVLIEQCHKNSVESMDFLVNSIKDDIEKLIKEQIEGAREDLMYELEESGRLQPAIEEVA
jgi:hypothetical protein